jgi:hypothetical protein
MVDLSIFERQRSVLDQQQLQEAFNAKKRAMQLQELGAMAQIAKAAQPETMTPYQAASLDLQRQQLQQRNMPEPITPYQAESLALQKRRLDMAQAKGGSMVDPDTGEIIQTSSAKPMPVGALKMQDEAVGAIGAYDTTAKNAADWAQKLRTGKVPVTPLGKTEALIRNKSGFSDEASRELGLYNTFIEKMRNDLLLLSKGVQTEGDAKRALNAITAAGNDPQLLADAMEKAAMVSQKAADLEKNKINLVRQNYGLPNLETATPVQPAGIQDGATATNPQTGQKIQRVNGKWVPMP